MDGGRAPGCCTAARASQGARAAPADVHGCRCKCGRVGSCCACGAESALAAEQEAKRDKEACLVNEQRKAASAAARVQEAERAQEAAERQVRANPRA